MLGHDAPTHTEAKMHQDPSEDNGRDSGKTPGDTPNGDVGAWLQVVGAFYSSPTLATGPIYDAGYFRQLLIIGLFLVSFGHMMLSLCRTYWQVLLAQARGIGLGAGVPSVAILATYLTTHISFAVGIAALGASIGGVVYPIVFRELQKQIGFAWSTRIIGFIALAVMALMKQEKKLENYEDEASEDLLSLHEEVVALQSRLAADAGRLSRIRKIKSRVKEKCSQVTRRGLQEVGQQDNLLSMLDALESALVEDLQVDHKLCHRRVKLHGP
ncbi:MFS monocarboxylate [Fusarium oxysporum f. sp. phaseoli]